MPYDHHGSLWLLLHYVQKGARAKLFKVTTGYTHGQLTREVHRILDCLHRIMIIAIGRLKIKTNTS